MEKKPYHHLSNGTFRNPEGSPKRDPNIKWSYKIFNEERKKKNIEFMALTEDERLSLIGLIPRKTFTAKKYKQEILKLRPQKKERVNGTGDKLGKMRDSIVGRRVIDYSGVFPVLQKNRIEPDRREDKREKKRAQTK